MYIFKNVHLSPSILNVDIAFQYRTPAVKIKIIRTRLYIVPPNDQRTERAGRACSGI